jgi:acylphosphatase
MTDAPRTLHVRIEGRVQGVGYRAWTERVAVELGLAGWVRNRRDGSVEAVFQGDEAAVEQMIGLCKRGPADGNVTRVEVLAEGVGVFHRFDVRPTV